MKFILDPKCYLLFSKQRHCYILGFITLEQGDRITSEEDPVKFDKRENSVKESEK